MIKDILDFFRGKKTYLVGALMILLGILQGDNTLILEGLGFWTIRAGVAKMSR